VTFSVPARAAQAVRPTASPGLLAAAGLVSVVFTATPFAIGAVSDRYGVSAGAAGLISTAQVGGFTVASLVAGRALRPTARLAVVASAILLAANVASAATPWFLPLAAGRLVAGGAMGLLTWIAWSDSAVSGRQRGEVAAVGPLAAAVSAPLLALLADRAGAAGLYAGLAVIGAVTLLAPMRVEAEHRDPPPRRARQRSPGAVVVLLALGAFTMGGSAIFVFATVIARERLGLTALAVPVGEGVDHQAHVGAEGVQDRVRCSRWPGTRRPWPWPPRGARIAVQRCCTISSGTSFEAATTCRGWPARSAPCRCRRAGPRAPPTPS
jgi:predicted MFS family arabinose efflux permease